MSKPSSLKFSAVQHSISAENVTLHASELHGMISGMICAGYPYEQQDYIALVNDMFNNGAGFPASVKNLIDEVYGKVWQQLMDDSFGFQPLIPEDDEALEDRSIALSLWVQGFNLGFGIVQKQTSTYSEEVQEVLRDFAEIANLSTEVDEDEENEMALFEIQEYVKVSALMIFSELGLLPEDKPKNETLH